MTSGWLLTRVCDPLLLEETEAHDACLSECLTHGGRPVKPGAHPASPPSICPSVLLPMPSHGEHQAVAIQREGHNRARPAPFASLWLTVL